MNRTSDPRRRRTEPLVERHEPPAPPLGQRLALIVVAAAAMAGAGIAIDRARDQRAEGEVRIPEAAPVVAGIPIAAEADVFRTRPGMQAVDPDAPRRDAAHPRTLATYRLLRSYPGAPPRIPHGLTGAEFREGRCNTCHERGGFSQRFGAYAPVNPHPERTQCLQCHAPADVLVGVLLPAGGPNDVCRQCHAGVPAKFSEASIDWRTVAWPALTARGNSALPAIPHELQGRGDCLACHMGPGAVAELRTRHPERANCRQCHVTAGDREEVFVRPTSTAAWPTGAMP